VCSSDLDASGDPLVVNPYYCSVAKLNKTIARDGRYRLFQPEIGVEQRNSSGYAVLPSPQ
jgi:hypothetical protein